MNDVAELIGPYDFFVAQLNLFQMIVLLFRKLFDVVHFRRDFYQFHFFHFDVEVFDFVARVVDAIKLQDSLRQRLTGGHRFVQIWAGGIDFLGEQKRRMNPGAR